MVSVEGNGLAHPMRRRGCACSCLGRPEQPHTEEPHEGSFRGFRRGVPRWVLTHSPTSPTSIPRMADQASTPTMCLLTMSGQCTSPSPWKLLRSQFSLPKTPRILPLPGGCALPSARPSARGGKGDTNPPRSLIRSEYASTSHNGECQMKTDLPGQRNGL